MKSLIKKLLPRQFISLYHYILAVFSNIIFKSPSKKLIVIGITGTKGKTSTANFIWSVLQNAGIKTGIISTANIRIGDKEEENKFHMTMPGRFFVQKTLDLMVKENCEVAVLETTSQGILQSRHVGVRYDVGIFTNLTPEHIESHGSFENYKKAKGEMFKVISKYPLKTFRNKLFKKAILANTDDEHSSFFLSYDADIKKTFSIKNASDLKVDNVLLTDTGSKFNVSKELFELNLPGEFNIYNALPAILVGRLFNLNEEDISKGLALLSGIPGRFDEVKTDRDFRVFVDYAHEPAGLKAVIDTANLLKTKDSKSIIVFGAPGGGRDKAKRPVMGSVASQFADIVIVTDDEPYDENPETIRNDILEGIKGTSKKLNQNLFVVGDRREGIKKALQIAQQGDIIVFTGLGHQKVRMIGKETLGWIEKQVVEEELKKLYE